MSSMDRRTGRAQLSHPASDPTDPPEMSAPASAAVSETLHRVANNLTILSATLRLERRRISDPAVRAMLDGAVARLDAMAQVHRLIYGLPSEARIDVTTFLAHLASVVGTSLGMGCGVRGKRVEVSGRTAEGLAVAMTELALNAYKHGYGGTAGDGVDVRVAKAPGGWVRLTVRDWGQGLDGGLDGGPGGGLDGGLDGGSHPAADDGIGPRVKDAQPIRPVPGDGPGGSALRGGLGLRLVASAVETLGGRMTAETNAGAHVVIEVPPS